MKRIFLSTGFFFFLIAALSFLALLASRGEV